MRSIDAVPAGELPRTSRVRVALRSLRRTNWSIGGSLLLLAAVALLALTQGAASIPPGTALLLLADRVPGIAIDVDAPATWQRIVIDVRLPRVLAAGVVGAALAYSGATYQGVFRNPLADPFLLGVASGAGLGASVAIIADLPSSAYGVGWVPLLAFAGAALAVGVTVLSARASGAISGTGLILAGVAVSSVAGAGTSFLLLTGGDRTQSIFSFLFGSFSTASWERLLSALPYITVGMVIVALHSRVLNVLQLDEEQAAQLGVDVTRTRLLLLGAASLMAATAVAVAGIVGFVGLLVPHMVRMLFGVDHRRLLPLTAILGAAFLIAVDIVARTAIAPQEVPVGIVTALAGGPFFLYLMRARRVVGFQ